MVNKAGKVGKVEKPDYKKSSKEALKLVGKGVVKQLEGIEKLCVKYYVNKTFLKELISNEELKIKKGVIEKAKQEADIQKAKVKAEKESEKEQTKQAKEEEKEKKKEKKKLEEENKAKNKAEKEAEKEKARVEKEAEKEKARVEKDKIKAEKESKKEQTKQEAELNKELEKLKIAELEETWKTCGDGLFADIMEKDFRKAQHYFTLRLMHENHFKVLDDNEDILVYCDTGEDEGVHLEDAEKFIATECETRLGEKSTIIIVKEIVSKIQRIKELKISRESIFEKGRDIIPVKNGILNMKTRKLSPFTHEKVFLSKSPATYEPKAIPTMWLNFLNSSLPNHEKVIDTIGEYFGYTLSNDNSRQKAIITHGEGATGQSTMQEVGGHLFGEKNISTLSIQEIEHDTFATAQLFGKKANMNPDIPKKSLSESSKIKKIIRGEKIYVQKKGRDGYFMKPIVKNFFGGNQTPTISDQSDGFFRSWIAIKFNVQFLDGDPKRIENLSGKIMDNEEEMSGILNWAIDGYNRLEDNNKFSKCSTIAEVKDFWLENSDSVSSFYKKVIVMNHEEKEIKENVYNTYVEYCELMNKPVEEQNVFFKRLKNVCDYKEFSPSNMATDRRRQLIGIKLLPLDSLNIDKNGGLHIKNTSNTG